MNMKTKNKTTGLYKGRTAREWFNLHEVMRKDFGRLVEERNMRSREPNPPKQP
jgi:hypothetical protein